LIVSERNTSQQTGKKERIRFNLFRMADSVIPNSFSQAEYIRKNFHFLEKKVMTIPNFVDLERFKPSFHQRHDVPEIIIAATIWPSKNTLGFIDAVKILAQKGLKFHVSWYGKNTAYIDYFNACKNKIDEKGVGNYICLLEKTDKITDRYKEADYFCLPSFYEGTPNVICEAMASGMPIMCSEVCDNSRYVQEGVNGTLFNPKDAESIAHKIEKMLGASDAEYEHFCNRSREMAENKLSKERFINDYVNLIEE
jgi:glycosyltransferase involved in cell wall biosynthesis